MSTPYTTDSQPLALPAAQTKRSTTRSYNASMQPRRVRISALFYPAPNITNEQFKKYWLEEHGKIFMSLDIVRKNLTKYEQLHFDLDMNNKLCAAMGTIPSTFWGQVIFEAESYDKILEVLSHPEYQQRVFPDEKCILDRSKSQVISGQFATIFEPERSRL